MYILKKIILSYRKLPARRARVESLSVGYRRPVERQRPWKQSADTEIDSRERKNQGKPVQFFIMNIIKA